MINKTFSPPLYGLVLAGGESSRMKVDKASLEYHGEPQAQRAFRLLDSCCEKTLLSNRQEQKDRPGHTSLPQIHDSFHGIGPLGGILTAMEHQSEAAWLVLACDLPYINEETIHQLIQLRNAQKMATTFQHEDGTLEPLCSIYEPRIRNLLLKAYAENAFSLLQILLRGDVQIVKPTDSRVLLNVNLPQEHDTALDFCSQKRNPLNN
jgi:molybdenum cofactor guanylyltransferase